MEPTAKEDEGWMPEAGCFPLSPGGWMFSPFTLPFYGKSLIHIFIRRNQHIRNALACGDRIHGS